MKNMESRIKYWVYIYPTIGIILGLVLGIYKMPQEQAEIKYTNDITISVSTSSNLPLQPTSIGADQLGSAFLWNQQGGSQGVQQNITSIDQLIGNNSIQVK